MNDDRRLGMEIDVRCDEIMSSVVATCILLFAYIHQVKDSAFARVQKIL